MGMRKSYAVNNCFVLIDFIFSSRRRHTRWPRDWSSDVCSSDLQIVIRRDHSQGLMIPVRNLVACYLLGTHKVFLSENIQKCRSLRGLPAFLNPEMLEQESVHMIGQLGSIFSDSPGDGI